MPFFLSSTAPATAIHTLSLHDALPISPPCGMNALVAAAWVISQVPWTFSSMTVRKPFGVIASAGLRNWPRRSPRRARSEEHTSELQSLRHLVCRLLLEKKKHKRKKANE